MCNSLPSRQVIVAISKIRIDSERSAKGLITQGPFNIVINCTDMHDIRLLTSILEACLIIATVATVSLQHT